MGVGRRYNVVGGDSSEIVRATVGWGRQELELRPEKAQTKSFQKSYSLTSPKVLLRHAGNVKK